MTFGEHRNANMVINLLTSFATLVALSGCAFVTVNTPADAALQTDAACTTSRAAPIVDTIVASLTAAAATVGLYGQIVQPDSPVGLLIMLPAGALTTLFSWSAGYGYQSASHCRHLHQERRQRSRPQRFRPQRSRPRDHF